MTQLLEQVVEAVRKLPQEMQDAAAKVLLDFCFGRKVQLDELDEETRAAIEEGFAQADRGEFASDEEMKALFDRHR